MPNFIEDSNSPRKLFTEFIDVPGDSIKAPGV